MATTPPLSEGSSAMAAPALDAQSHDPFHSVGPTHHRFSHFNAQLFALGPNASPAQAKRALEAHLAETDRRMEEAGKLGTALVQQRNELTERLKEVEKLQAEGELSDDLRQKLVEIERDYNEVARESARAFLPKSRVPSNEAAAGSPFVPEGKGGKRSVSPSKFEAQATASPTKLSVPNRKIRNQPSNRIHDIEFAAEISTSLIAQVRNLQGLLAEKDEELKDTRAENSKLEYEVEGFQQRLKALDDNEHRYKDENWNLETQIHELMAKEKEAADREKKLTQALNILQSEKNAGQRELDEIKLTHSKLAEEHAAAVKHHDIELGTAKRTMVMGESERAAMQKKIEELTGQNTELAKAVSVSIRGRKLERESIRGMSEDDFHTAHDNTTPEQSPPASPVKSTPRHSMLESETLKTSLAHAQRTIQSLRTNVHREKTEKMETRRLLQEARDEIEKLRSDTLVPSRRARKTDSKEFKKPTPRLLGGLRSARSEIFADDPNWEDQPDVLPHPLSSPISRETTILFDPVPEQTDHFETANETSDAAFETANENATETDDFHTGAEEFSSDDAETETESPSKRGTLRGKPPSLFPTQRSGSIDSTASTEDEDFPYEEKRTPTQPPVHARFPLRVSRGAFRRSRNASEDLIFQSSPASIATSSNMGTPQQPAQSLAAELGDFDGSDNESNMSATPSRRSTRGRTMSPPPALPPLPRVIMVDSGMMTEPVHELSASLKDAISANRPVSMNTVVSRFSLGSEYSDVGAKLAEFPSPPTTSPKRNIASMPELALSMVHSHDVEPLPEPDTHAAEIAALRAEHAERLEKLTAENASAHAAAIVALKSQHADEFTTAKDAHAQELESLRSNHADIADKTMAEIHTAHAREIESIRSRHADEISQSAADALASHGQELESLKTLHAQQLAQKELENQDVHAAALESLKTAHAEELSQKETESAAALEALKATHASDLESLKTVHTEELLRKETESATAHASALEALKATHASDLESLKITHIEELSRKETESAAAHTSALEALKIAYAEELARKQSESKVAHAAQVEALKAAHAQELSRKEMESATIHASALEALKVTHAEELTRKESKDRAARDAEIEALKAAHAEEISEREAKLKTAASIELEALKANHAEELSNFKTENAAVHAAELAALVETHASKIDAAKKELSELHAREFEDLKSSHADQIDQAKQSVGAAHSEQLESLKASHLQQIDDVKNSINATHTEELESLRAAHAKQLEDTRNELTTAQATAITSLTNSHNTQLDETKSSLRAAHSQELESLKASHTKQVENLRKENDAAHGASIAALIDSHNKQIDEVKDTINATHAQELERLKASHVKQLEELGKERDAAHATVVAALVETHTKQLDTQKADGEAAMSRAIVALKAAHAHEIETLNGQHAAAHAKELEGFKAAVAKQIESSKTEGDAAHSEQIEALNAAHAQIIEAHKRDAEIAQSHALDALKSSHERHIDTLSTEHAAARTKELETLTTKHLDELKDLRAEHAAARTGELEELTNKHLDELKTLKSGHEASHSQLREELGVAHSQELEALRQEIEAKHLRDLELLRTQHEAALATLKSQHETSLSQLREELGVSHSKEIEAIRRDLVATNSNDLESLQSQHVEVLAALKSDHETSHSQLREELGIAHSTELEALRREIEATHSRELEILRQEINATHSTELESLSTKHAKDLEALRSEHEATITRQLKELEASHSQKIAELQQEGEKAKSREVTALGVSHAQTIDALKGDHEAELARRMQEIAESHAHALDELRQQHESDQSRGIAALSTKHQDDLEKLRNELESVRHQESVELESAHAATLASLRAEHQSALEHGLSNLEAEHSKALDAVKNERDISQSEALSALGVEHSQRLDELKSESDAVLARELDALRAEHARILESQVQESDAALARELDALKSQHKQSLESQSEESNAALVRELDALKAQHARTIDSQVEASNAALTRELDALKAEHELTLESHIRESAAENENLLASHAAELEALRASLTVMPPALGYSPLSSVETEPVELPEIKSPRREAFIIPQDKEPMTPHGRSKGRLDRQLKTPDVPVIAEDDTRQSPSAIVRSETPDSQQPFKEITANTDARALRKPIANMSHQGSQTMLTADGLDKLMKNRHHQSQDLAAMTTSQSEVNTPFDDADATTPSTAHRRRPSTDSFGSVVRTRHPGIVAASEPTSVRRPGSSASVRSATLNRPPLPLNHREVIEAVRSHSAHGGKGTMAPPLLPASTYRPSSSGPQTPSNRPPLSPSSVVRGTPTPRAGKTPGYVDVQAPARIPMRSRQSSMSSFASEIDTRFNIHNGMGMDPSGFGSSTDPRMIQAVTQTMIGEYLWKYTRKAGRGEMSENRHRRFFWVHPYTRALYWSDSDPAAGGRGEMRAKSVPIEAVRVVADDNPMPPGLHRKSLVVIAPGRTVKFTCTTGQRHETWFNALSYLLLRSSNENKQDSEEVTGNITQEDVDEFNPSINRRSENSQRPRPPPSLSSYNSRTTRNESPSLDTSMTIPTLTPTHEKEAARSGTFGKKLSGYWRSSSLGRGTFNSLRGRSYQPYDSAIYEASEVPDSAEDLRQIIEQQDRESDRLENVRACCDGKHDVGTLSHTSKRGRLPNFQSPSHTHTHPGPSGSQPAVGSIRSRS
ncbi:hypothetical protein CHU98_g637 [Xylaria longipes]|nr:hypothetical protein CHU98_g637 [Xylaria longipes]